MPHISTNHTPINHMSMRDISAQCLVTFVTIATFCVLDTLCVYDTYDVHVTRHCADMSLIHMRLMQQLFVKGDSSKVTLVE